MASPPKSNPPLTGPIVFDGHATPVKSALFFIICTAWILPGLIGHDPWKSDDAVTFGTVLEILRHGHWAVPHIAGVPHHEYPPLYAWLAALTAMLFSPILPLHDGARLATGICMALTFLYVKKTAARLHDERAGRIAVLLLLGCLGLLLRGHEMNPEVLGLTGFAVSLYGLTRLGSEAAKGGLTLGAGGAITALSIGLLPALLPLATGVATMALLRDFGNRATWRGLAIGLALACAGTLLFLVLLVNAGQALDRWWGALLGVPWEAGRRAADWSYFVTLLPWYALPALPFAIWVWVKDRRRLRERLDSALPLAAFVVVLVGLSLARKASDAAAMTLLIPLAVAASAAPDRLPRGVARFVDWFGLVFFGLGVIALWLYWTAAISGTPAGAARAVARQVPGFNFEVAVVPLLVAMALTGIWLYAVVRAHRNNRRAIVNWSAGLTILWVLPNLLALPAIDHVRSYRFVAQSLARNVPQGSTCVGGVGVGDAQRALLDYWASIRVRNDAPECPLVLTQGTRERPATAPAGAALTWEGARPGDNLERLRLYARPADPAGKTVNNSD
ncbi:MAG: glycosyltransferase family 39 protein [Betaproteobacteria bacterium]|nr:glycosyltransferase family 39 protein [Betaproteobacteria bacterium]